MSPVANPEPELPAAEELVAYLDGELPPDDCRRVEQRLAADVEYRQRLRDLDQAWEALDALPATKADDDFARTTMELATIEAQRDVSLQTAVAAGERRRRLRWWAGAGIAAAGVGFIAAWMLIPTGNKTLLADLPVIRQVDLLMPVEDIAFLRRLSTDIGADKLTNDKAALRDEMAQLASAGAESLEARRQWVETLTTEQKATLAAQAKRFNDLTPGDQQRLRSLELDIRRDEDAERLQKTLLAYGQWHAELSPGEQEELRADLVDLTTEQHVDRVEQFVRQVTAQASRQLSAEDAENLRNEVFAIAQESREVLSRRRQDRGDGDRARRLEGPRGALMILSWQLADDEHRKKTRERLVNRLSPEAQARLERLDNRGRWQLQRWIRDSLELKAGPDELESFFASEKLGAKQREWLLSLPADEMQTHLERMYYEAQLGLRDNDRGWSGFRDAAGWEPPRQDRPGMRHDGPPRDPDQRFPPPQGFPERGRFDRRPNGPRGPQPGDPPDGRHRPNHPGPRPNGVITPGEPEAI